MAYNFYSDIENWSKAKSEWDAANQAGDEKGKANAHAKAQVYGENLRKNGYAAIADEMSKSNYQQSQNILKKYESQKPQNYVFTPEGDVGNIYKSKGLYDEAIAKGDQAGANNIAAKAQAYYQNLKNNGYSDVANELAASNYSQAKAINDKWAKYGKTPTRDYYYSLGQKHGLSNEDIDNLISWDNDSKQLYFGGALVGSPDAIVDGVSYWGEDSLKKLDDSFNNHIARTGKTISNNVDNNAYSQRMTAAENKNDETFSAIKSDRTDVQGKYNDIFNYANSDVTKTDEYKSTYDNMMAKYDLSALQGRDNAVASGGASNGGNIDSYAAANAMRQQAALTAQGQQIAHQAGLDAYNSRVTNVRGILNDLGVYNQGTYDSMYTAVTNDRNIANDYFKNDETAKNNEVDRLVKQAGVTGLVPTQWTYENNIYLNSDGTVRDEFLTDEFDASGGFTTIINEAKAKLATTTDPTERAQLQATINAATQAKALKTFSSPKYAKYAHEVGNVAPAITEERRESEQNDATVRESLEAEKEVALDTNAKNLEGVYDTNATNKDVALDTNAKNLEGVYDTNATNKDVALDTNAKNLEGVYDTNATNKEISADTNATNKEISADTNATNKEISLGTSSGGKLSENGVKVFKQVAKNINDSLKSHKSNPDGRDLIIWNGGKDYKLNLPDGHQASWWKTQIIRPIIESSLSESDIGAVLASLFGDNADEYYVEVYNEMNKLGLIK